MTWVATEYFERKTSDISAAFLLEDFVLISADNPFVLLIFDKVFVTINKNVLSLLTSNVGNTSFFFLNT